MQQDEKAYHLDGKKDRQMQCEQHGVVRNLRTEKSDGLASELGRPESVAHKFLLHCAYGTGEKEEDEAGQEEQARP